MFSINRAKWLDGGQVNPNWRKSKNRIRLPRDGRTLKITDPYGKLTNFYYDNLGQLTKKIGTRGEVTELSYDENGNTIQEKTPSGQLKHFYYDNLNQLVRKLLPDDDYNFTYDVRGNVTSVKNLLTKIDISYQHFDGGDVISQIHSYGIGNGADLPNTTLSYNYNDVGEKVGMVTPKGSFQYGRDAAGRLRSITNHKGEVFTMKYDLNQRLKEITTPATIASFSFDQSGFNTQINHTRKSGATIEKFIYGKDEVGNRISKTTSAGVSTYNYDKNYQLLKATTPNLPIENFAYDSLGNRTSDNNSTYTYDQSKQQVQEDYKYLYTFDANGNMTSKQEKGFTGNIQNYDYSSENQMRSFKLYKNGQLAREAIYTYDALGRRIEKEVVDHEDSDHSFTKRFAYDGSEILFELDDNNSITQTYTHSTLRTDDPLAVANASGTFYFVKDGLGSITDITDDQGFKVQHYEYSAFGKLLAITDVNGGDVTNAPMINQSYSYTGREYDGETELYYYRARYYDANIGRFLQVDPDAGRMSNPITHINKYSYVGNDPTNLTDSSGRSFLGISNTSLSIATGFLTGSAAIGGIVKMYQKNPQLVIRAFAYTAIVGVTIATGGLAPVLIGAALGGTIGYFASGRTLGGAQKGILYGALGGGLGSVAALAAGSSIGLGVAYGATAGAGTAFLGSRIIENKNPSWKSVAAGAAVGGFFGAYSASVPAGSAAAVTNDVNSSMIGPTTDAAQGSKPPVPTKFNFDPY